MNKYFSLETSGNEANIDIYGDITSWEWTESDISSYTLSKMIDGLDVDRINVYVNSYGGEVAEGLAIRTNLKRHKAKIVTYCDGFACSIASVVFMAGDERIMADASLLMIHEPWTVAVGDAYEMQKEAKALEACREQSITAYMDHVNISEEQLKEMIKDETWINPTDALEMGFASAIGAAEESEKVTQSARKSIIQMLSGKSYKDPDNVRQSIEIDYEKLATAISASAVKAKPVNQITQPLSGFFNAFKK